MVRLLKMAVLAATLSEVAYALPTERITNESIMWRRDVSAVPPEVATPDDKAPNVANNDNVSNDDSASADDNATVDASRKPRKDRCRTDADCGLGYLCNAGQCIIGCRTDNDCNRGHTCLGGQCRTSANPPPCRPYKQTCFVDQDCCSGVCGMGWFRRKCKRRRGKNVFDYFGK